MLELAFYICLILISPYIIIAVLLHGLLFYGECLDYTRRLKFTVKYYFRKRVKYMFLKTLTKRGAESK